MQVAKNTVVSIDYTLTDPQGQVIDSSRGGGPLPYLHGAGGIIPGLERQLEGKNPGDRMTVTVQPGDAYGERNEEMVQEVPRASFQGVQDIRPGMQFQAQTEVGDRIVSIVAVGQDTVTVDANHPLAGVPLTFDVTVVDVREATETELAHGHVHGPGGHHH